VLEDVFDFGFASIPNDAPQELDPFGSAAVEWNAIAQYPHHTPVSVEMEPGTNPPAFPACDIAVTAGELE